MAEKIYQVVLDAAGCSGRAVRYRRLSITEHNAVASLVSNRATKETTFVDFRMAELHEGVQRMLVGFTKEPAPQPDIDPVTKGITKSVGEKLRNEALWEMSRMALAVPGAWDATFTPKDDHVLSKIYERNHDARPEEVDAILGKAEEIFP